MQCWKQRRTINVIAGVMGRSMDKMNETLTGQARVIIMTGNSIAWDICAVKAGQRVSNTSGIV